MALKIEDEVIEITSSSDEDVPHEIELLSTEDNALLKKKEKCRKGEEEGGSADPVETCETSSSDGTFIGDLVGTDGDKPQPEVQEKHGGGLARGSLEQEAGPSISLNTAVNNKTLDYVRNGKTAKSVECNQKKKNKDKRKGSQKQIRGLERLLEEICEAIKRLEERELTLDEMDDDDSVHIQEYQLRKRFMKVYNMCCEQNGCSPSTGRVIERKIHFEGTRFPEINKRLERLINKKDFFPDFQDVHKAVYKTNLKKNLRLDRRRINSIAQEAFEDVGRKLQERRQEDFIQNFSAHSTLDFSSAKDPSDKDPELRRKLFENKKVALQKIREVEESFVKRQEEYEFNNDMEVAKHSESDVFTDEEDVSTLKRRKVDQSDWEEQERNDNENKGTVELQTSTPVTLSSDDSDSTELNSENPGREAVIAKSSRESGSCSPTSTQPDLEMHLEPDIEEVKVASTRHALKWSTEQQLENTTTNDSCSSCSSTSTLPDIDLHLE